jgi:hypothetical protein
MATGNHYFLDVLAGVFVVLIATGIVEVFTYFGLLSRPGTGPATPAEEALAERNAQSP